MGVYVNPGNAGFGESIMDIVWIEEFILIIPSRWWMQFVGKIK